MKNYKKKIRYSTKDIESGLENYYTAYDEYSDYLFETMDKPEYRRKYHIPRGPKGSEPYFDYVGWYRRN